MEVDQMKMEIKVDVVSAVLLTQVCNSSNSAMFWIEKFPEREWRVLSHCILVSR